MLPAILLSQAIAAPGSTLDARGAFAVYCRTTCSDIQTDLPTGQRTSILTRTPRLTIERWDIDELGLPDAEQRRAWGIGDLTGMDEAQDVLVVSWAAPAADAAQVVTAAGRAALSTGAWFEDLDTGNIYSEVTFLAAIEKISADAPDITALVLLEGELNEDGSIRLVTRGLGKFGLPELQMNQVPEQEANAAGLILNATAQTLFERGYAQRFELNGADIKSTAVQRVSCGIVGQASLAEGHDDHGDLLELTFEGSVVACTQTDAAPPVAAPEHARNPEPQPPKNLDEARSQAAALLNGPVRDAYTRGLGPGEALLVKAPFFAGPGRVEWMWVQVTDWRDEEMVGLLANEPNVVRGIQKGDSVVIENRSVFDYMLFLADGRREGNTTAAFLR